MAAYHRTRHSEKPKTFFYVSKSWLPFYFISLSRKRQRKRISGCTPSLEAVSPQKVKGEHPWHQMKDGGLLDWVKPDLIKTFSSLRMKLEVHGIKSKMWKKLIQIYFQKRGRIYLSKSYIRNQNLHLTKLWIIYLVF